MFSDPITLVQDVKKSLFFTVFDSEVNSKRRMIHFDYVHRKNFEIKTWFWLAYWSPQ